MKLKLISTALAAVASVAISAPAQAEPTATPPIGQWRDPLNLAIYFGPSMGPKWGADQAIANWNSTGTVHMTRVYDKFQANITVKRKQVMPDNYAGYALWDIERDETGNFNGYYKWCSVVVDKATAKTARLQLLQHEIGHCLGLLDNYAPEEAESIMSYDDLFEPSTTGPTALDFETLAYYYSMPASAWWVPATTETFPTEPVPEPQPEVPTAE